MTKDKKYIEKYGYTVEEREYIEKTLKEYPNRINVLKKLDLDIEEMYLNIDGGLKGIDYSRDVVQTSNISSTVENQVLAIEKEIEGIRKMQNKKRIHFDKIQIALGTLTDIQNKIIEYRYFKGYTWYMVERNIGLSDRQCININNEMIKLFIKTYKIRLD